MGGWEYLKIDLNQHRPRGDELEMLNAAGADGWELVGISANNIAYLKRPFETRAAVTESREATGVTGDANANGRAGVHEVKAKYRDRATNETWSGRGRMAT